MPQKRGAVRAGPGRLAGRHVRDCTGTGTAYENRMYCRYIHCKVRSVMQIKEGSGWKAGYNAEKNKYGAEVIFQGSWDCYEIPASTYNSLSKNMSGSDAERLITETGRRLYSRVNDRCGPPYTVVLDDDYADYCPWLKRKNEAGKTWSDDLTDAAVELFESEKKNREQRRKKREQRKKK